MKKGDKYRIIRSKNADGSLDGLGDKGHFRVGDIVEIDTMLAPLHSPWYGGWTIGPVNGKVYIKRPITKERDGRLIPLWDYFYSGFDFDCLAPC